MFKRSLKSVPREVGADFDGCVIKRIQFDHRGGFKVTASNQGKEVLWLVPNDLGNRHCQFIREWIANSGFPEDPGPIVLPSTLGLSHHSWYVVGQLLLVVAGIAGALVGVASLIERRALRI